MGTVVLPLAAAGIGFMLPGWLSPVAVLASGGIVLCLFALILRVAIDRPFRYALGGWGTPLGIDQAVDGPAVLMLLMTALGDDPVGRPAAGAGTLPLTAFALAAAGLALIGTPPGGAFVAKWSILTMSLASGHWWWGIAAMGGSLLAAIYVYRLLLPWFHGGEAADASLALRGFRRLQWVPLTMALASLAIGFLAPALAALASKHAAIPGGFP